MKFRANPSVLNTEDALKMIEQVQEEGQKFTSKRGALFLKTQLCELAPFYSVIIKTNKIVLVQLAILLKKNWNKG